MLLALKICYKLSVEFDCIITVVDSAMLCRGYTVYFHEVFRGLYEKKYIDLKMSPVESKYHY